MHNRWSLSVPCFKPRLCLLQDMPSWEHFSETFVLNPCTSVPGQVQTPCLICFVWRGFDCMNAWKISILCENICLGILAKRTVHKHHSWWWFWCLSTLQIYHGVCFSLIWKQLRTECPPLQLMKIDRLYLQCRRGVLLAVYLLFAGW